MWISTIVPDYRRFTNMIQELQGYMDTDKWMIRRTDTLALNDNPKTYCLYTFPILQVVDLRDPTLHDKVLFFDILILNFILDPAPISFPRRPLFLSFSLSLYPLLLIPKMNLPQF